MSTKTRRRRQGRALDPFAEPAATAQAAQLRYVTDGQPGIRRKRAGRGFSYAAPDGSLVRDRATLSRIRSLAIPPAWTEVWICPMANGHLQASGRDARGRKQYRYHPRWRAVRDETKYERMTLFGHTLPKIRARVAEDLAGTGLGRDRLLATIVRLLETTLIRVGNEEYARTNGSYGLTTLKGHHVEIEGTTIRFRFRGKSRKQHAIALSDRRLAGIVRRCRDLPGQDLFQYLDEHGEPQPVNSADVNEYLRVAAGEDFTAKDFRTWAGTLLAARSLPVVESTDAGSSPRSLLVGAVQDVAGQLGNTAAVCRKCYIHPAVLKAFEDEELLARWRLERSRAQSSEGLSDEERALLSYLEASNAAAA
jgi:DNA topoisomerase-1